MLYDNPAISDSSNMFTITFKETPESILGNPEDCSHFINNIKGLFRKSRFYKDYKSYIYQLGLNFDQTMKGITSDMATIELHHHLPTLQEAVAILLDYHLYNNGCVNSYMILNHLIELHRSNLMGVIMLSQTNHEIYHDNPSTFISIRQLYGNPLEFQRLYGPYFPLDVTYRWINHYNQEKQYGLTSYWPTLAKARDELINWSIQKS